MVNVLVGVLLGLIAGWFLHARVSARPAAAASGLIALMWDGTALTQESAVYTAGELLVGPNKVPYNAGVYRRCGSYFLICAQPLALATHEQLQQVRISSISGAITKTSSDMMRTIQYVLSAAVIGSALFVASKTNDTAAQMAAQNILIGKIQQTLSQPLVVQK